MDDNDTDLTYLEDLTVDELLTLAYALEREAAQARARAGFLQHAWPALDARVPLPWWN